MSKIVRWILIALALLALWFSLAFGRQAPAPIIDAAKKQAVIDEISTLLNKNYIFAETAKKMEETLRARLKKGDFDKLASAPAFAQEVSKTLSDVSKDGHIGFAFNPAMAEDIRRLEGQSEEEAKRVRERRLREARWNNFGFRKVERLPGNVGYLDFRGFASPDQAGETAIAAMNFLAYCDAVIVDLRQNGGGDPAQIQLISTYFFDEPVHLNDLYARAENRTENYWTLPYVPGPRASAADLYILTSARTFSGAEEFTYNMKNLKRATVIGETTGGGAHPTSTRIVQRDFILRVPFARAINPVSKTNWEGTGVAPDIACPAAEAFDRAYAMAVEKLAAKAADPRAKAELESILAGEKAKKAPTPADDGYAVLFYSGRGGNKDVYILHPGEKEPRNLTNHPAQDICPAASPDGARIAFLSDRDGNMDIYSMALNGRDVRRLTSSPENKHHPEYTPDGKRILFVRDFEKRTEIWIMDADGSNPRRLTNSEARDERPFLSPDGSQIVFMSNRDGNYEIYTMAADGGGQKPLTRTPEWEIFPVWSPDGKEIAYSRKFRADGRMQGMIRVMNADGSNDRAITEVATRDENAMWSPDGRFIIFQSVRDSNFEVYRIKRDGGDPVRLTNHPDWDGWASFVPRAKK